MLAPTNKSATAMWILAWPALFAVSGTQAQEHSMDMGSGGRLGDYSMMRDASGTAWQPDGAAMSGTHRQLGSWATMLHGYVFGVLDHQGGPRGDQLSFSESMLMATAQRTAGKSRLPTAAANRGNGR